MAAKIACVAKNAHRQLTFGWDAIEVICLAEILKEQQVLEGICTFGKPSMTPTVSVYNAWTNNSKT